MNPTQQQELIINSTGDIVIIANPGSGKTFVVSEKIKRILPLLPDYKGVVAISYTNKASQELKNRCLKNGLDPKSSFFGTIDRFYVSEIIVPFAKHLFGLPKDVIKIVKRNDLSPKKKDSLNWLDSEFDYQNLPAEHIQYLKNEFLEGNIVLESIGIFAIYVFDKSIACKNYLRSRYATIVIDEYQDSGREQHAIFLRIRNLGIEAIAVGDANQSIFKFSGKSSEFLLNLAKEENNFALYPLDYNHRCHPSITNYSLRLLNKDAVLLETEEINVFEKKVTGNEADIAIWINEAIPKYCTKYGVTDLNAVAILVRSGRTGQIISDNLNLPHKYFVPTLLDDDFTIWSAIFREILYLVFNSETNRLSFIETYIDTEFAPTQAKEVYKLIQELKPKFENLAGNIDNIIINFEKIANILSSNARNTKSIDLLKQILIDESLVNSFKPPGVNEIQLMTLHKSKGLEFDIVFHLDLYEWILPAKSIENNEQKFLDIRQDANLHYVGITRAKKCLINCYSTNRTNYQMQIKSGAPSEFLTLKRLEDQKFQSPF